MSGTPNTAPPATRPAYSPSGSATSPEAPPLLGACTVTQQRIQCALHATSRACMHSKVRHGNLFRKRQDKASRTTQEEQTRAKQHGIKEPAATPRPLPLPLPGLPLPGLPLAARSLELARCGAGGGDHTAASWPHTHPPRHSCDQRTLQPGRGAGQEWRCCVHTCGTLGQHAWRAADSGGLSRLARHSPDPLASQMLPGYITRLQNLNPTSSHARTETQMLQENHVSCGNTQRWQQDVLTCPPSLQRAFICGLLVLFCLFSIYGLQHVRWATAGPGTAAGSGGRRCHRQRGCKASMPAARLLSLLLLRHISRTAGKKTQKTLVREFWLHATSG